MWISSLNDASLYPRNTSGFVKQSQMNEYEQYAAFERREVLRLEKLCLILSSSQTQQIRQ